MKQLFLKVLGLLVFTAMGCNIGQLPSNIPTPTISASTPVTDSNCPGALPPRLHVDGLALVTKGQSNVLRSSPGINSPTIRQLSSETELTILGGPQCVEGQYWWQVNSNSDKGWVVEGQGSTYLLDPEASPANTN